MKQLLAAGTTRTPAAFGGTNGPTVRAASAGVRPEELHSALGAAGYTPPPGADRDRRPVRLALLSTASAGRVLAHVAPRDDGYLAHALLNVPATADALLAIQTWGSPLWQRREPDTARDLPDLPYLPVADVLDDEAIRKWLDAPARRDMLEYVFTALLGSPPTTRVVVAAPADDVAKVVYAVTRALPSSLLDDFTFSTYEPDPLACPARLVGHDTGADDRDLPEACYHGPNVGYNPALGRKTDLPAAVPFAGFAVQSLADGNIAGLDDLKATWHRLGLTAGRHFDLFVRLARGTGVLTKDEAAEALQQPALATWIAARADAMNQLLEWALDDRGFATASFSRAVMALRQRSDAVTKLAQTVREAGVKAIKDGDKDRAANALEVVLPMVAPGKANAVWGDLVGQITDPDRLPWGVRWYLLPRFVRFKQQQNPAPVVDPAFDRWLAVPAERADDLFALDLPRAYQIAAGRACLKQTGEPTPALVQTLARHPHLTLTLLQPADGTTEAADLSVKLFQAMLAEDPGRAWFGDVLAAAKDYPAPLLNRFFEATLDAGKVDADRLVRTHGPALLDLFAGQTGLDRIGTQFLAVPPADVLHNSAVLDFLAKLHDQPKLSGELKARIAAVRAVRRFLDGMTFTAETTAPVAAAFTVQPPVLPPAAKGEVFAAVAAELLRRSDSPGLQADLEAALRHLGPTLATDATDLYENLLRDLRTRTDLGKNADLSHAFLAVALGATQSADLAAELTGLEGHAFAVASDAAGRGGNRLLNDLDRRSAAWPRDARAKWGFLLTAVRPQGAKRLLRDAALFLAGAGVATAAVWVARLVG